MMTVLSLGAGVQSSTLALMAAHGEVTPMPAFAVFADTQAEPRSVYQWLDYLEQLLPFPVRRVSHGHLGEDTVQLKRSKSSGKVYWANRVPVFMKNPDGSRGVLWRKCTRDYKVLAIRREVRREMATRGLKSAIQLIGISRDEAHRMKDSEVRYLSHAYPLVDRGMTRGDCLRWMEERGYPRPPRSACVFCPYHSDAEWLRLKLEEPEGFAMAVQLEKDVQAASARCETTSSVPFLHDSLVPLLQVDFEQHDRQSKAQLSLWGNECEGMCGV